MGRSKNGQAVPPHRLSEPELARLTTLRDSSRAAGDLDVWLRARAVLGYIAGQRAVEIAEHLEVGESSVRDWLRWYAREGADGLLSAKRGASKPKLDAAQREELGTLLDAGPQAAGLSAGMWTGKAVAALILARFGVSYHVQSVPRLLHEIGFSVQRPRKRLARADPAAQAQWKADRLPAIKKKRRTAAE